MDLRFVGKCEGLHKEIPIALMDGNVMTSEGCDRLIIAFCLSVGLLVVCSRVHVFCTEMTTQDADELAD